MNPKEILAGASIFLVADVRAAADHYRDVLGFRYEKLWGDPPGFCMAWRDRQCVIRIPHRRVHGRHRPDLRRVEG